MDVSTDEDRMVGVAHRIGKVLLDVLAGEGPVVLDAGVLFVKLCLISGSMPKVDEGPRISCTLKRHAGWDMAQSLIKLMSHSSPNLTIMTKAISASLNTAIL